jgi:hypothetical protein
MKSVTKLGLALGLITMLPSQLFAGEVTHWLNENASPIYYTSTGGGLLMFVAGGVISHSAGRRMDDAQRRLKAPEDREKLAKQLTDAERDYQTEKAKLEKMLKDAPKSSKSSNVISLDAVREQKNYELAKAKYKNLQAEVISFDRHVGHKAATSANMIKAAKKDLKRSEMIFSAATIGQLISIPVVFVPAGALAISNHIEKSKAEAAGTDSREPASAPSQSINPSAQ